MSSDTPPGPPLQGLLVVSLEQAVAAPYCSRLLADGGARVVKLERPEGDFARAYDSVIAGQSAYFVWLNTGKESAAVDLRQPDDVAFMTALLRRADVFIQNLRAGAVERLGFGWPALQQLNPRLIMCNISGFGEDGPDAQRKAYDALVQAESGLCSVTGPPGQPSKVGISVCDIASGLTAFAEILKALRSRDHTGHGSRIDCSLFGVIAEWMAVPWAYQTYAGRTVEGRGMDHGQIAPYGDFQAADGSLFLVVQNDREWQSLCSHVLGQPALADDPRFATNSARSTHTQTLKALINQHFAGFTVAELRDQLEAAGIACGAINTTEGLSRHSALLTKPISIGDIPATMVSRVGDSRTRPQTIPALDEHGTALREEFS